MAERGTMHSAGSAQAFAGVTPVWLRPAALALAACVHLVVLVGIPWPTRTGIEFQRPLELQVIPQGQPTDALRPLDTQQLAEVRPADAPPSERPVETTPAARAQEVAAAAPAEAQASDPAERLAQAESPKQEALVASEPAVTETKPSDTAEAVAADPSLKEPKAEIERLEAEIKRLEAERQRYDSMDETAGDERTFGIKVLERRLEDGLLALVLSDRRADDPANLALGGLGRHRFNAWFPNRHRGLHANYILEVECGDTGAKSTVRSVGPIREHSPRSHSCFHCLPNLIQRNFGFGLELNLLGYPGCLPAFGISCPLLR